MHKRKCKFSHLIYSYVCVCVCVCVYVYVCVFPYVWMNLRYGV